MITVTPREAMLLGQINGTPYYSGEEHASLVNEIRRILGPERAAAMDDEIKRTGEVRIHVDFEGSDSHAQGQQGPQVLREGQGTDRRKGKAARICQAATGQVLQSGRKPKGGKGK